jgi:hypothetical protein
VEAPAWIPTRLDITVKLERDSLGIGEWFRVATRHPRGLGLAGLSPAEIVFVTTNPEGGPLKRGFRLGGEVEIEWKRLRGFQRD